MTNAVTARKYNKKQEDGILCWAASIMIFQAKASEHMGYKDIGAYG